MKFTIFQGISKKFITNEETHVMTINGNILRYMICPVCNNILVLYILLMISRDVHILTKYVLILKIGKRQHENIKETPCLESKALQTIRVSHVRQ